MLITKIILLKYENHTEKWVKLNQKGEYHKQQELFMGHSGARGRELYLRRGRQEPTGSGTCV